MNCALWYWTGHGAAGGQIKRGEGGEGVRGGKETEGVEYFIEVTQWARIFQHNIFSMINNVGGCMMRVI